jgi:hypothetical protein
MFVVLSGNLIPILLAALAWWMAQREHPFPSRYRLIAFRFGLCAITISAILLCAFVVSSLLSDGVNPHDFASHAFWIPSALLALIGIPFSLFGIGISRMLAAAVGVLNLALLYMAGLATSY